MEKEIKKEIETELLAIKEQFNVSLEEIKMAFSSLECDEKSKKKEEKRKQYAILTNEKVSKYNIKENRDIVFSDVAKILNEFSTKNKDILDEVQNDGFCFGGKNGKRNIYVDNLGGYTGLVYDTSDDPITTNSKLIYELRLRTNNLFVKFSTFSDLISEISKYFNIDNLTYLDSSVAGYYRKKTTEIPNQELNVNYISFDININKKTILISYNNTKDEVRQINREKNFEKKLKSLGVTVKEFDSLPWNGEYTDEQKIIANKLRGHLNGYYTLCPEE